MTQAKREVYVLTNPAMPGLVKVGLATTGVENRAHSLSSHAGIPTPFEVVGVYEFPLEIDFKDLFHIEREAHRRLAPFRHTEGKEFFKTTPTAETDLPPCLMSLFLYHLGHRNSIAHE